MRQHSDDDGAGAAPTRIRGKADRHPARRLVVVPAADVRRRQSSDASDDDNREKDSSDYPRGKVRADEMTWREVTRRRLVDLPRTVCRDRASGRQGGTNRGNAGDGDPPAE